MVREEKQINGRILQWIRFSLLALPQGSMASILVSCDEALKLHVGWSLFT